jgi:hypothetical protein
MSLVTLCRHHRMRTQDYPGTPREINIKYPLLLEAYYLEMGFLTWRS